MSSPRARLFFSTEPIRTPQRSSAEAAHASAGGTGGAQQAFWRSISFHRASCGWLLKSFYDGVSMKTDKVFLLLLQGPSESPILSRTCGNDVSDQSDLLETTLGELCVCVSPVGVTKSTSVLALSVPLPGFKHIGCTSSRAPACIWTSWRPGLQHQRRRLCKWTPR